MPIYFSQPLRGYQFKCLLSIANGGNCSLRNCCPCGNFKQK